MSIKLGGKQVYLQEGLTEESYQFLLKWFTDIDVMNYSWLGGKIRDVLNFKTVEEVRDFCQRLDGGKFFLIFNKMEDKLIGYMAFSEFKNNQCEFGIYIGEKEYWGKGIGLEVTELMVNYAFDCLGLDKVVLSTSEFHKNAINLYEKVGFKIIKIKPEARTIFHNNEWVKSGTVLMEITKLDIKKEI